MSLWLDNQGRVRPGWRFLLGAVVAVIANFIAIGVAGPLSHGQTRLLEALYRPLTMVLLLGGYALLLMSADQVHERLFSAMGLGKFPGWVRQALWGAAIGTALTVVAVLWIVIFGDLRAVSFSISKHALALALVELFILSTAAMGEELMFRGYPFHRLVETTGPVFAVVVMSSLFGFAHGGNPHASKLAVVNTCAIGALLCTAYLRTGALWMSWGIHFAWNTALGLVFGLPVSGLANFAVILRTRASGPRWVTGGAYGIEGSVVGTIVILMGFIPVILLTRKCVGQPQAAPLAQPGEWDGQNTSDPPSPHRIQEG
ncbi:MAG TPA: type II CAAX endopeptidase family protein [Terriglobales bacterium]